MPEKTTWEGGLFGFMIAEFLVQGHLVLLLLGLWGVRGVASIYQKANWLQ